MTKTAGMTVISLFAAGLCMAPFAIAAPTKQSKMAACSAQANGVYERMPFSKAGKGGRDSAEQDEGLQQRSRGGESLKGEERKKFMSTCLSN